MAENQIHQEFYDMFTESLQDIYSAEEQYAQWCQVKKISDWLRTSIS